jgi:immunity protein 10 of polymorphic toxin system
MVIEATNVVVDDGDPGFILVGFDSEGPGPRRYLMLQRSHEFDEQDVALGMDHVHIERDSQGYSAYGGIMRFELRRDRAMISLNAVTARMLGNEEEFEVKFDLEDGRFEELRAGLAEVFKGFECFADRTT